MKKVLCVLFGFVLGIGAVIFAVTRFITKEYENKTIELIRTDILVPSIRNTIYALFFGDLPEKRNYGYGGRYKTTWYVPYHTFMNRCKDPRFSTTKEAKCVLGKLEDIADNYNFATIYDLKNLTGDTDVHYTDNKYGWTKSILDDACIKKTGESYTLCMPRPVEV